MRTFDYAIEVQPLMPPIGDRRFIAKFSYFYETGDGADKAIPPPISEAWGSTEEDARNKLEAYVQKWQTR